MLHVCILLCCLVRPAIGLSLREARLSSEVVNAAEVKGQGAQKSELDDLREQTAKIAAELSEISSQDVSSVADAGVGDGEQTVEDAFKLPADLQQPPANDLPRPPSIDPPPPPSNDARLPAPSPPSVTLSRKETPSTQEVQGLSATDRLLDSITDVQPQSNDRLPRANVFLKKRRPHRPSLAEEAAVVQATNAENMKVALPIFTRPNIGQGPDVITFGLFAKTFYGINLKDNSFAVDIVMAMNWVDQRVVSLIPAGLEEFTLSKKDSEKSMWLPGVVVTNRDIKKYDLISTAVSINRKGEVSKVERAMAVVKNKYQLNHYPYDTQELFVKIASAKYMANEVVLQPAKEGNGLAKGLLDGYSYKLLGVGASAIEETMGPLSKSRGVLTITVKRDLESYIQSHLIPTGLVMAVSCLVFWFPFVAPFITPRLALSVLALLTFTNLMIKSNGALPPGAPFNWNDITNQTILTLMMSTICLNIFAECCFHQLKVDDLARRINHECKFVLPFVSMVSLGIILSTAGPNGWMTLGQTSVVVKLVVIAGVGTYVAVGLSRTTNALAMKRLTEAAKAIEPKTSSRKNSPKGAGPQLGTNPNLKASA